LFLLNLTVSFPARCAACGDTSQAGSLKTADYSDTQEDSKARSAVSLSRTQYLKRVLIEANTFYKFPFFCFKA